MKASTAETRIPYTLDETSIAREYVAAYDAERTAKAEKDEARKALLAISPESRTIVCGLDGVGRTVSILAPLSDRASDVADVAKLESQLQQARRHLGALMARAPEHASRLAKILSLCEVPVKPGRKLSTTIKVGG